RPSRRGCASSPAAAPDLPSFSSRPARARPVVEVRKRFPRRGSLMAKTPLQELADQGQSVWIDYLSRPFVHDGDLKGLVDQGVVGETSNHTIYKGAIEEGVD